MSANGIRRTLSLAVTLAAGLVLSHGPAQAQEKPRTGGHLRVAWSQFPTSLDAVLGRAGGDAYYWRQIYDQLVDADESLQPAPSSSLAESWEVPNPKTLIFKLRKGVTFHDGTPFNAAAVKFNIERVLDPETKATPKAAFEVIESVTVVNEHTVRFNLKRPWGAALSMLADRGGAMNSPTAVKKGGKEYGFAPVGTGPFKVAEVVPGSHVRFVRYENYWRKDKQGTPLPYLDELTIKFIRDDTVLVSALRAGEIDLAYVPYNDAEAFQNDPKFNVRVFEGGGIAFLVTFNLAKPPMDNVNLRLAVSYAIDPEAINKAVDFNRAIVAKAGMWPVRSWVYDPSVPRPHYSLEKAHEYLKKGGKPDGFELDVVTWTNHQPAAEIVRAQLAKVGIKVNLHVFAVGPATEKFFGGREFPAFLTSWSRYPEPDWIGSLSYKSDGYYNAGKVPNAVMDKLLEDGASAYDIAKRKAIYRKVNEIVLGEAWYVPMLYGVSFAAAPKKVGGLETVFGWDAKMDLRLLWLRQ